MIVSTAGQRQPRDKRTRADKRNAVQELLDAAPSLSDRAIAAQCGVSPTHVARIRADLGLVVAVRAGQDGRMYDLSRLQPSKARAQDPVPPVAELVARIEALTQERDALAAELAELRLLEATPADLAATLDARPVTFETPEEFEARMAALPPDPSTPKRRKKP